MNGKDNNNQELTQDMYNLPRQCVIKTQKPTINHIHQLKQQQGSFQTTAHTTLNQFGSLTIQQQLQQQKKSQRNRQIPAYPSIWQEKQLRQIKQVQQDSNQAQQQISSLQSFQAYQSPQIPPFLTQYMSDIVKQQVKKKKNKKPKKNNKKSLKLRKILDQPVVTLTFPNKKKYMIGLRDLYKQWHYLLDQIHR